MNKNYTKNDLLVYYLQEIVGNLVTHIGSGVAGEIDTSLDVLSELVETNVTKMAPFAVFVKVWMDIIKSAQYQI